MALKPFSPDHKTLIHVLLPYSKSEYTRTEDTPRTSRSVNYEEYRRSSYCHLAVTTASTSDLTLWPGGVLSR